MSPLSINHAGRKVDFDFTTIRNSDLRNLVEKAAKKLYGYFLPSTSQEPFVTICYTDHISDYFDNNGEECIQSETAQMNSHQALVGGHGERLLYDYEEGMLRRIFFEVNMPSRFSNEKSRATSRAFMSAVEYKVNTFYTRGYLCGMQQVNIEQGYSFMHACSFAVSDDAYVVAATPGAGKSSLLLSLCFSDEIQADFISDDFSLIDNHGHAHQIGRAMAIKSHQIQYFPKMEERLQGMSRMQRIQWFLLKKKGLKRLAAPSELFGDHIVTDKQIKKVFYLTNHNQSTFVHEEMDIVEFAGLNANMLFSELYLGMEIRNHALILPGHKNVMRVNEFIERSESNILNCLKDVPCTLVKVPFRSDPRDLLKYLLEQELIKC